MDTTSVAGIAVFSSLAIILAGVSQTLGLNFPVIPYLQFDLGEVAIIMAFFIFGPLPGVVSSFVEFAALMIFGQNVPVGPVIKLFALLSTVGGLWIGSMVALRIKSVSLGRVVGASTLVGSLVRAAVMTISNFYLIVFVGGNYSLAGLVGFLKGSFALFGIGLTDVNGLILILGFTAIFNVLQLLFVMSVSYFVLRVPVLSQVRIGGRAPWFASVLRAKDSPAAEQVR